MMRDRYCGKLCSQDVGRDVRLCGWVHRYRDHGGVLFADLRDHTGLVQLVFDPAQEEVFARAHTLRHEYVVAVKGAVRMRPEGTANSEMDSGEVEVVAAEVEILNPALTPPFQLDDDNTQDEVRLKYRYIDLRRPAMQGNIRLRHQINQSVHRFLDKHGFIEVETPILTRSTPEGARDYLVASRTHAGAFFALPQSPQLFKQLLMASGVDRYYQIARCFRDEDLRADRQPEFTQLDIEAAFMDETALTGLIEDMICTLFREVLDVVLPQPFPRLAFAEALQRYGTDRPDLRNPLELVEISDLVQDVAFQVFSKPARERGSRVAALRLPNGGKLSRKHLDGHTDYVRQLGATGLAYIRILDRGQGRDGLQSPILKFLSDEVIEAILTRTAARDGDLLFFGADRVEVVNTSLAGLRDRLGQQQNLLHTPWQPLWVIDFPLFQRDRESGSLEAMHHPFTAPACDLDTVQSRTERCLSRAYDLVLNGIELGGGSIRIHRAEVQLAVLKLLGMDETTAQAQFGFLLEALARGCPPHGGIALGLDRLTMLMRGTHSIREVIAFPKTQTASCPLSNAPTSAQARQLRELGIRLSGST